MKAEVGDYVRSAAALLELPLGEAQIDRVALHLARTRGMAALLDAFPLAAEVEPVALFCPAPFPEPGA